MNKHGLLLCCRYAISPNFFGYCGPRQSKNIIDHLKEEVADKELTIILSQFETLFPYLQLIARKNRLNDPFNLKVVEAYWLGNSLLKPLSPVEYQAFSQEKLNLEKKVSKESLRELFLKINHSLFFPHHAFHVFNVFKQTKRSFNQQTLMVMDQCRINWGQVVKLEKKQKETTVLVLTQSLIEKNNQLTFSQPLIRQINLDYNGASFINNLKIGDWLSFHWGFVCDRLTARQIKNLKYFTNLAINFYNF